MNAIQQNELPSTSEVLSDKDRFNEYIMTGIRTIWGVSLDEIEQTFGTSAKDYLLKNAQNFIDQGLLEIVTSSDCESNCIEQLKVTSKGKFLVDGIASDLFMI